MKTKKIIADSMPHALKMVRKELGENAIIVNTAVVKTGGLFGLFAKQKYEVTAYSVDGDGERTEPKYSLELKRKSDRQAQVPVKISRGLSDEGKGQPSSGFHSKPQNLYQYYSQPNQEQVKETTEVKEPQIKRNQPIVESHQKEEEFIPLFNKSKQSTSHVTHKNQSDHLNQANLDNQVKQVIKANTSQTAPENSTAKPVPKNNDPVLDELQQMRKMMMNYMLTDKAGNSMPESVSKWVNHLKKQGVDEEIVQHLIDRLLKKYEDINAVQQSTIKQAIAEMMIQIIGSKVPNSVAVDEKTRMINMIGPTGVGKTTSIAKLATEQVLKQKRRVAMITTDVYRIAAVEQLKTYAGILNVPIEVVRSAEELKLVLDKLAHYDLIYMDTTGRNYKEEKFRKSINQYLDHPFQNDNYLVLSLTTKYEDMVLLLNEFKESPINKLILTKFDETSSYGAILNIAYKYPYQISYLTNGQSVPEDILVLDAQLIVNHLLGEENSDGSSSNPQGIYASIQ